MKLYVASFSPNPRRVRIYLQEKGLTDQIEQVKLDMVKGEHRTDEFRQSKNPLGRLPVLELDDGRVLTESMAIIEYLEELHPEPALIGTDSWQRARTREANRIAELGLLASASIAFQNVNPFFEGRGYQQLESTANYGRHMFGEFAARADQLLGRREWLAGDQFTVADITAICAIDFGKVSGCVPAPELANMKRWLDAIRQRPSCALKKKKS